MSPLGAKIYMLTVGTDSLLRPQQTRQTRATLVACLLRLNRRSLQRRGGPREGDMSMMPMAAGMREVADAPYAPVESPFKYWLQA